MSKRKDSEHLIIVANVDALVFVNGRPLGTRPGDLATTWASAATGRGHLPAPSLHEAGRIGERRRRYLHTTVLCV